MFVGIEYKIKFVMPMNFAPSALLGKLPSPIERSAMAEIYNYAVESDGFYFVDHLVKREIASEVFRLTRSYPEHHRPAFGQHRTFQMREQKSSETRTALLNSRWRHRHGLWYKVRTVA